MEKKEALYWVAVLQLVQNGDKEMRAEINRENERRAEKKQPTVQQELQTMLDKKML
ncbi:MAG: hypothetical protein ACI4A8_10780 [Muribaculaceae bacterium]